MNGGARPRIAVIAEGYGTAGGSERFVQEVTERLAATGRYQFHVFAHRWRSDRSDITFHRVPRIKFPRFLRPWFFTTMAQRRVARGGFDLVHAHWPTFRADVFSTHGAPHAFWVRHVLRRSPNLFDRVMMHIDRRMIGDGADTTFMPVSRFLQDRFGEVFGTLPGRWLVQAPGVDADRFAPDPTARAQVRAGLGIPADSRVLLFVGMNFQTKGLARLIDGLARARRASEQDLRLLVVGRGDQDRFARLAAQAGLAGSVHFTGPQPAGIERFYAAADAFALVSEFETFGMVVLEAMAAGLPVLVSDRMGAADLVVPGEQGWVVPALADADSLGERIATILDPATGRRMGEAGRAVARRQSWQGVADAVDRVYRERLDAATRGPR